MQETPGEAEEESPPDGSHGIETKSSILLIATPESRRALRLSLRSSVSSLSFRCYSLFVFLSLGPRLSARPFAPSVRRSPARPTLALVRLHFVPFFFPARPREEPKKKCERRERALPERSRAPGGARTRNTETDERRRCEREAEEEAEEQSPRFELRRRGRARARSLLPRTHSPRQMSDYLFD